MSLVSIALFVGLIVVVLFLLFRLKTLRKLLLQLQEEQGAMSAYWRSEQANLSELVGTSGRSVVTIEIFNAVEVASSQSVFAKLLGKCAPHTLSKQVYKQTANNLQKEMTAHGMHVEVKVRELD